MTHVSTAALRHKYAILEHELRLQVINNLFSLSIACFVYFFVSGSDLTWSNIHKYILFDLKSNFYPFRNPYRKNVRTSAWILHQRQSCSLKLTSCSGRRRLLTNRLSINVIHVRALTLERHPANGSRRHASNSRLTQAYKFRLKYIVHNVISLS